VGLKPELLAYYNYYPFGMEQPGRVSLGNGTLAGGYRFGFNGKEKDNNGELGLTNYDYGFRIYNPAYGRFLSKDPLTKEYPWFTPYQFAGNIPIRYIDLDGLECADPQTPSYKFDLYSVYKTEYSYTVYEKGPGPRGGGTAPILTIPNLNGLLQILSFTELDNIIPPATYLAKQNGISVRINGSEILGKHLSGEDYSPKVAGGLTVAGVVLGIGASKLGNTGGYISGKYSYLRSLYTRALGGEKSAEMELRVAKLLKNEGKKIKFVATEQFATVKAADMIMDGGGKIEVKMTSNLSNLAGNLAWGVSQVGDGGQIIVVRGEKAAFTLSELEDYVSKFKPKRNVDLRVVDESALPKLKK
jgi:RHS repeat-associated protein